MSGNERSTVELLYAQDVGRTVARIAHQFIEKTALDDAASPQVVLLGIPSGGVPLAQRIAAAVEEFSGVAVPVGSPDVTLYRDDDQRNRPHRRDALVAEAAALAAPREAVAAAAGLSRQRVHAIARRQAKH